MAAPKWFETTTYFNNKLAQMQRDEPEANWTADSLTAAFEKGSYNVNSADSMYTHFEQYGNTATERVSPNQYFDNDYYMNSKLAQMQATNPGYTMAQLETAMFSEGNMSPWTHYTLYGITEGIDPSAGFNTKEYMAAKLAQMQAEYPDENWTMDSLFEAFRAGNLNPIEHYFEYGVTENLDFEPGDGVTPPAEYNEITLTSEQDVWEGTAGNDNFIGTVGGRDATLTAADTIDGGAGQDRLTVTMNADFNGFKNADALTNVEDVVLSNATKMTHSFNARNTDGVQVWTLNEQSAPINLTSLPAPGVTVNINGLAGNQASSINFALGATAGTDDAMTIGLADVGNAAVGNTPARFANVRMAGVENVTLNASGDNYANLSQVTGVTTLNVTGDGNLRIKAAAPTISNLDGSEATGNLNIDLSNVTDFNDAKLGSGNDVLKIANIQETSVFDGGEGNDTVELNGVVGSYRLQMTGVETLQTNGIGRGNSLVLSGSDTTGLTTLVLNDVAQGQNIVFAEYDSGELNVQTTGLFQGDARVADIQEVNLNVGNDDNVRERFAGTITIDDATTMNIHVGGKLNIGDQFDSGTIIAPELNTLTINNDRNAGTFTASSNSQLNNVSQLEVTGFGDVNLAGVRDLGKDSQILSVNASTLEADFSAAFGTGINNSLLYVQGSQLKDNNISIDGSYSDVNVTTGLGNDTVSINFDSLEAGAVLNIDLGLGTNVVNWVGDDSDKGRYESSFQNVTAWNKVGTMSGKTMNLKANPGDVAVGDGIKVVVNATDEASVDLSGLTFTGADNGLTLDNVGNVTGKKATVTLGDTGAEGAKINLVNDSTSSTKLVLNMTEMNNKAVVDATACSSNGAAIQMGQMRGGVDLEINLDKDNGKGDYLYVSIPETSVAGTWTTVSVNGFVADNDHISFGPDLIYDPGTNPANVEKWLKIAGFENVSNLQRDSDAYAWQFDDADGKTNTVLIGTYPGDGRAATAIVLVGVNDISSANIDETVMS